MTPCRDSLLDSQHPDARYVRQQTDGVSEIILCCKLLATGGFSAKMQHTAQLDDLDSHQYSIQIIVNVGR